MKQKISYSSVVSALSIVFFVAFVAIFVLFWVFINKPYDNVFFWILFGLFCLGIVWICCSIPYSVDADDDYVSEYRPMHTKRFRMNDIKSVENAREDRGYHFRGKFKEPVLITLKDGSTYVIGTSDSKEFINYVNGKLKS